MYGKIIVAKEGRKMEMKLFKVEGFLRKGRMEFDVLSFETVEENETEYKAKWLESRNGNFPVRIPKNEIGEMKKYFHVIKRKEIYTFLFADGKEEMENVKRTMIQMEIEDTKDERNKCEKELMKLKSQLS